MDVKLTIYSEEKEHFSRVVSLPCVIGRGKQCDVAIVHPLVSRRHCEIYEENGCVMTRDLGSLNGTFYHRTRIGRGVNIPLGDSFTIGKLHFKVEDPNAAPVERNAVATPMNVESEMRPSERERVRPDLELTPEPPRDDASRDARPPQTKNDVEQPLDLADDSVVIDLDNFLASDASVEQSNEQEPEEEELLDLDSYLNDN